MASVTEYQRKLEERVTHMQIHGPHGPISDRVTLDQELRAHDDAQRAWLMFYDGDVFLWDQRLPAPVYEGDRVRRGFILPSR